jgi:hypothetical protein
LIAGETDLIALGVIHSQSLRIVQSVPPESRGLSSTRRTRPPDSDFVKLIGEVVSVEHGLIPFHVQGGKGTIKVNEVGYAESYRGATGCATTLTYTI